MRSDSSTQPGITSRRKRVCRFSGVVVALGASASMACAADGGVPGAFASLGTTLHSIGETVNQIAGTYFRTVTTTSPYFAPAGGYAQCSFLNAGTSTISVKADLMDSAGSVKVSFSNEPVSLNANTATAITTNVGDTGLYYCRFTTADATAQLRGDIVIMDANQIPLVTGPAR